MRKEPRKRVWILPEHREEYIRLVGQEKRYIADAVKIVHEKFQMPVPHNKESVRQMLEKQGIFSVWGRPDKAHDIKQPKSQIKPKKQSPYTWTEHQEQLLRTFLQAKEAENLLEETHKLKEQLGELRHAVDIKDKELHSSREYELLIKQGKIPAPLLTKKEKH